MTTLGYNDLRDLYNKTDTWLRAIEAKMKAFPENYADSPWLPYHVALLRFTYQNILEEEWAMCSKRGQGKAQPPNH